MRKFIHKNQWWLLLTVFIFSSCCREMTEANMSRWEKKTKFEKKVSYVKYPGKKKVVIRY